MNEEDAKTYMKEIMNKHKDIGLHIIDTTSCWKCKGKRKKLTQEEAMDIGRLSTMAFVFTITELKMEEIK